MYRNKLKSEKNLITKMRTKDAAFMTPLRPLN